MEGSKRQQAVFWGFVGVALAGGIALTVLTVCSHFYGHEVTREVVRALGEALLIAAFIAATVDRYAKDRILREITKDVSKYLIGYNLPPKVQDRIKELMGTAIIRRDYRHTYIFERTDGNSLKMTIRGEYTIENCTNSDQPYTPRLDFEPHEQPVLIEFRCDSADQNAFDRIGQQDAGKFNFSLKPLAVRPVSSGMTYKVSWRYYRFVKQDDSDLMAFRAPTIDVTISVECPDDNIVFDGGGDATVKTLNYWKHESLFTRGQHLHPRWSPRT